MDEYGTLRGRVALVTGASRNLGAATALRFARAGARVAVNYSSPGSAADAERVVQTIREAGCTAMTAQADVGDELQVDSMVNQIVETLGDIDTIVNNAATSVAGQTPWDAITATEWDDVLRVNVTGGNLVLRGVDRACGINGARVVNVSSIRVATGQPGNLHYTASKAAQIGVTRVLARELAPRGVRVNALLVGAIRTPAESVYGTPEELDREVFRHQALQFRGEPDHVAAAAHFLVSEDAAFITGQTLAVDGGWTLH